MEQVLLEEEQQIQVPQMQTFRDFVDHVKFKKRRDEIYIKLTYLLASRASELLTKVTPYMTKNNMTKPYGLLLKWEIQNYKKPDGNSIKLLLVKSAIAKRKKRMKGQPSQKGQAVTVKVKTRITPIILDPQAEPWCLSVLKWLTNKKENTEAKLSFDFVEMTAQNLVRKYLRRLDPKIHPHLLRHYRINHLIRNYNFSPYQISAYVGWSLKGVFGSMGMASSSNLDIYSHLSWQDYVDKLTVPLQSVI